VEILINWPVFLARDEAKDFLDKDRNRMVVVVWRIGVWGKVIEKVGATG